MQRQDFFFELPDELIARYPAANRVDSRLLCLDTQTGALADRQFLDIEAQLNPGDLLVFNNTQVIPARLWGHKSSGGKIEILIERVIATDECLAHIRSSKSPKAGAELFIEGHDAPAFTMLARDGALFHLKALGGDLMGLLQTYGHMPLPPYIDRADEQLDQSRYQTVYAKHPGAVAAPTAGLHFDAALLARLKDKGVAFTEVTLHVGAGTFQPVRADNIEEHVMHAEWLEVGDDTVAAVAETRQRGGRVIAVGTTSVRCLETAGKNASPGHLKNYRGDTTIFIYPGYTFNVVDGLLTNFHLPESTLIMLVSALAGREPVLAAYRHAVAERYRFFSYGDAMFVAADSSR